jgi:ATP-binding cassette subfamily B protein
MELGSLMTYGSREISPSKNTSIEFRNVSFRYPGSNTYALKGINLLIRAGEKVSIVGENGAGKTTLVKLLTRLYDPDEGQILVNGLDIRELSQQSLYGLFSVVFQDYRVLPLTMAEAVTISANYSPDKLDPTLEKAGFSATLDKLPNGVNTIVEKSLYEEGVELSGGELQRLAIARALYKDAPIAILDEPTAALDPEMELEVYKRFNDIIGERTTIFISHRLASCRFCDRIVVFSKGEIVEIGGHDELLDRDGLYARMWEAQAKYYRS